MQTMRFGLVMVVFAVLLMDVALNGGEFISLLVWTVDDLLRTFGLS
jgi:hypothetical protein